MEQSDLSEIKIPFSEYNMGDIAWTIRKLSGTGTVSRVVS